jgi:hypothetical protein
VLGVVLQQRAAERQQLRDSPVREPVVDARVLAAGLHETAPAQARQVIRDLGLRLAEPLDEIADRQLAVLPQQLEDAHPRRVAQPAEVLGDQVGLCGRLREHERRRNR